MTTTNTTEIEKTSPAEMVSVTFAKHPKGRKTLAALIGTILGSQPEYLGTPSFAYRIGEAVLDRDWRLTMPNQPEDQQLIVDTATQAGYETTTMADVTAEESDAPADPEAEEHMPAGEQSSTNQVPGGVVVDGERVGLTIALPTVDWEPGTGQRLQAMLAAKGALVAKALNIPAAPVEFAGGRVVFDWFDHVPLPEVTHAVTMLVAKMVQAARTARRVSSKPTPSGVNEKYAMRCWLLRLGFIGPDFKDARRVLTRNLDGNSAWHTPPTKQPKTSADGPAEEAVLSADTHEDVDGLVGRRVRLIATSDPYTRLKPGDEGTIQDVDSLGTVHVRWDSGSGLGLVPGEDSFELL